MTAAAAALAGRPPPRVSQTASHALRLTHDAPHEWGSPGRAIPHTPRHLTAWNRSAAQHCPGTFRGRCHGSILDPVGLLHGQSAVVGPQPQRIRERLAALTDLIPGVDVEQPD